MVLKMKDLKDLGIMMAFKKSIKETSYWKKNESLKTLT